MKKRITRTTIAQRKEICRKFHKRLASRHELARQYNISVHGIRNILICHMSDSGQYIQRPRKSLPRDPANKIPGEIWKDLRLPTKGKYIISNHGRIKSFVRDKFYGNILRNKLNSGYLSFDYTSTIEKKKITVLVHVLVAEYFLKKPKGYHKDRFYIVHKNYNHYDNRSSNLKYVDSQQWRDRIQHNKNPRRFDYLNMNLETVAKLKKEIHKGQTKVKDLAHKYEISQMQVARIARGDNWSHVLPHLTRKKIVPKYTSERVKNAILKLLVKKSRPNQKEIAKKFKVTETVVSRLKKKYLQKV